VVLATKAPRHNERAKAFFMQITLLARRVA